MKPSIMSPSGIGLIALLTLAGYSLAQTPPPAPQAPPTAPATAPAAEPAPPPPPEPKLREGIVKVGSVLKKSIGRLTDVDAGDNGCYITLKDDKGDEFIEITELAFCKKKPSLIGKRVELEYRMETIRASSCGNDPKCKKTTTEPFVVNITVLP
ncbi:MAG: hypothetical protein JNM52_01300 [Betaproteobacteria bacterium]|nr:hypothetical protein [Betaproteobacteria bacterium]